MASRLSADLLETWNREVFWHEINKFKVGFKKKKEGERERGGEREREKNIWPF